MIRCPFCKEDDFDLIGLKSHLEKGHCSVYEETETYTFPRPQPIPSNSCNRHDDCKAADEKFEKEYGRKPGFNFHCHDDECPDCFGN